MIKTSILKPTPDSIEKIASALTSDEIVGIPTETVYGLAGNGLSPIAVSKIFSAKERPTFDPLILHFQSPSDISPLQFLEKKKWIDLSSLSQKIQNQLNQLAKSFWPGPLTLVLPKTDLIPDLVTSGLPSVALRMPAHSVTQSLLSKLPFPLAAPSANRFGRISPTSAQAVFEELEGRISYILEGGNCQQGVESTILLPSGNGFILLRPGAISQEILENTLGEKLLLFKREHKRDASFLPSSLLAPGLLDSHYAPRKSFYLLPQNYFSPDFKSQNSSQKSQSIGLLLFCSKQNQEKKIKLITQNLKEIGTPIHIEILDSEGDLSSAAQNFFQAIRNLDHSAADILMSEPCPHTRGLGLAITDRLHRASQLFVR